MIKQEDTIELPSTVCVIESDAGLTDDLAKMLAYLNLPVRHFPTAESFLDTSTDLDIACILANNEVLGERKLGFLSELRRRDLGRSTIVMTRVPDIDDAVLVMKAGVADYLEVPLPDRVLISKIRNLIGYEPTPAVTH